MKRKLLIFIACISIFTACTSKTTDNTYEDSLVVKCFLSDSLGVGRDVFNFGEEIWLNYSITNNSSKNISYYKVTYIEELINYCVFPWDSGIESDIIYLPPPGFIEEKTQIPGEKLEVILSLPYEVGEFRLDVQPLIWYEASINNLEIGPKIYFQIKGE